MTKARKNRGIIPAKEALLDIEWFEEVEQHIFDDLRHGSYEKALDLVDSWLDMFKMNSYLSKQEVHLRATPFMVSLQRIAKEHRMVVFEWKNELVKSGLESPHPSIKRIYISKINEKMTFGRPKVIFF
ncbi:hypothetical protein [Paenibacillus sp. Marseille-Q4541]|uniref:hypothetical protein n=1 Tax=Paenibacillus sp. Marseille-Q4541 TaxID=2831522 RepID=UPI001BA98EB5|nr:hypothetical protein [Paenibacillus sp. Marseille-Q4541]